MRNLSRVALVLLSLVLAACDGSNNNNNNSGEIPLFDGDILVRTPPGGTDFGVLEQLDRATHQATIADVEDADGYDVTLAEDALVIISVQSLNQLNPFVELYDAAGVLVTGDDNGGLGADALIVEEFPAGDYTIVVWSSDDGSTTGEYELNLIVGSLGEDLGILDAGVIVTRIDVPIAADADAQSYVFTLSSFASVDIVTLQTSGAANLALQLVDQRGVEVLFFDPDGLADPVVLDEPLDPGTYLLIVSNAVGADSGVYDVTIDVLP